MKIMIENISKLWKCILSLSPNQMGDRENGLTIHNVWIFISNNWPSHILLHPTSSSSLKRRWCVLPGDVLILGILTTNHGTTLLLPFTLFLIQPLDHNFLNGLQDGTKSTPLPCPGVSECFWKATQYYRSPKGKPDSESKWSFNITLKHIKKENKIKWHSHYIWMLQWRAGQGSKWAARSSGLESLCFK